MDKHTATEQAYKRGYEDGKQDAMKWIPVSEPPKERGCYLISITHWLDGKPVTREAKWNGADWLSCYRREEITPRVTHWMPLPQPAKEG